MSVYCLSENILQIPFYPFAFNTLDNLEWLEEFRLIDESNFKEFLERDENFGQSFPDFVSFALATEVEFDDNFYLNRHTDVKNAFVQGKLSSPMQHFFDNGASEFRTAAFSIKNSDDIEVLYLFGSPIGFQMSIMQRGANQNKQAIYFISRITEYPQIAELAQFWKTVKKNELTRLFVLSDTWFFTDFIEAYSNEYR
jgi:hypothetical protein